MPTLPYLQHAIVLLTACPVTKGHEFLLQFATRRATHVTVIMPYRSFEPLIEERLRALRNIMSELKPGVPTQVYGHRDDNAPQSPPEGQDDSAFWKYWADVIRTQRQGAELRWFRDDSFRDNVALIVSESWGPRLAQELNCRFVPADFTRTVHKVSGTAVRKRPYVRFADMAPAMQRQLRPVVTLFGAESVGKTSLLNAVSELNGFTAVPEWARGYLEITGPELTPRKMEEIVESQDACQAIASFIPDRRLVLQDTDLLSTYGYYRLLEQQGRTEFAIPRHLKAMVKARESDLYLLISQKDVPFKPDPLRYGGDKRETEDQFWIDLLEEFGFRYKVVDNDSLYHRIQEVQRLCVNEIEKKLAPLENFVRD